MKLKNIDYILAVAQYLHFGKAAQACFVSQPALSIQVRKFEENLGVELFERSNKSVMLTPAGKEILPRLQQVAQSLSDIKQLAASMQGFAGVKMMLGGFPTLAPYLFPSLLPAIKQSYPDLQLYLVEDKTEVLIQMLIDGQLDIAVLADAPTDDALESTVVFEEDFYFAIAKDNPLALKDRISASTLTGMDNVLLLSEGHCLRDQAASVCWQLRLDIKDQFQATSLETLRTMVSAGIGVTIMPKLAIRSNDGNVYLPFSKSLTRQIYLVWRKISPQVDCYREIVNIVKKTAVRCMHQDIT